MIFIPLAIASVFSVIFAFSAIAADFTGPVLRILDGDTIDVLANHHAQRIQLYGIDCPENGQAYETEATQAATALIFGKAVILRTHGKDKDGRILADVLLLNGHNINHELVRQGWCWWYRKFAPGNTELAKLEQEARDAQKGIWVDPDALPPWEWRNR